MGQPLTKTHTQRWRPPEAAIGVLREGLSRARVDYFIQTAPFFKAKITRIEEPAGKDRPLEVEALISKDISYVTEEYVPARLKEANFLD